MDSYYRKAARLLCLGMFAALGCSDPSTEPAQAESFSGAAFLASLQEHPEEEEHGPVESGDPLEHGQGEAMESSATYSADQDQAARPPQWQAIDDHIDASRGPEQPIPFNHRFHVTDLQIDCMYCHTGTERSVSGVVPPVDVCLGCHRVAGSGLPPIEELREYGQRNEPIPWKWVNKLPEYVQFSHQPHLRNDLACQDCHGPVEEMDRVYQWASFTMGWCLECHRGEPEPTDIATDHLLASEWSHADEGDESQEGSLYPRVIDVEYGQTRAPTDCAACHY